MERLKAARPPEGKRRSRTVALATDKRLIEAATALLDSGGEAALTLRAVGHASGISHNAPYKHFRNRDALLAAVATTDFIWLTETFREIRKSKAAPGLSLMRALSTVVDFSKKHPARYRMLFNDPAIAALKGDLEKTAGEAFGEFILIVKECRNAGLLPEAPETTIAGLLFATLHGLIALEGNGRMHPEKGLHSVQDGLQSLIRLLASAAGTDPKSEL